MISSHKLYDMLSDSFFFSFIFFKKKRAFRVKSVRRSVGFLLFLLLLLLFQRARNGREAKSREFISC